ncbi:unnamed protein product [Prunus armeniaca]
MRYPFGTLTVSKLESEHTYVLVTSRGSHWDKNAPQLECHAPAARGGVQSNIDRQRTSKSRATLTATTAIRQVEQLIQLRQRPIRMESGWNFNPKFGRNLDSKSSYLR